LADITADHIVKLFEEDVRARKRLAELLVTEPDIRLAIINAILRDVATKSDLKELEERLRNEFITRLSSIENRITSLEQRINGLEQRIVGLEQRIARLEQRVAKLEGQMSLFIKLFIAFNLPILMGIIGILLKMLLAP